MAADRPETLLRPGQLAALEYHVGFSCFPLLDHPTHLAFDLGL
ncbi:MAG: hypothetical protein QJR06_02045 [Alicyclobacillaceae bacterium]|nr:hypothetical protein [Alicyclobacillaceae bacterium]